MYVIFIEITNVLNSALLCLFAFLFQDLSLFI